MKYSLVAWERKNQNKHHKNRTQVHRHQQVKDYPNERCEEGCARSEKVTPAKLRTPFKKHSMYTSSAQLFEAPGVGLHFTALSLL